MLVAFLIRRFKRKPKCKRLQTGPEILRYIMPINSEAELQTRIEQYRKAKNTFKQIEDEFTIQKTEFENQSLPERIACALYVATASNVDREMWMHETASKRHDWSGPCHRKYVSLANTLLEKNDAGRLLNIFNTINTHLNKM